MSSAHSCSSSDLSPEDFAALAASLQEMAETVIALCRAARHTREPETAASTTPAQARAAEQRQFRLPGHAVQQEQELLKQYEADSLAAALNEIHMELYTTIFLMKNYSYGDDEQSFHIHLLGMQLERTLKMLRKACSILADYIPLPKKGAATQ